MAKDGPIIDIPLAEHENSNTLVVWKYGDDETTDPFVFALAQRAKWGTTENIVNMSRDEATALRDALTRLLEGN